MKAKAWLWLIACAGCSVADRDYTGATIEVQLTNNDFDSVHDTTPEPVFTLGESDVQYSIVVEVFTQQGEFETKATVDSSKITSIATSFALAGMELPEPSYDYDDAFLDPRYTSTEPIVIPASAKGSALVVHATGRDNNGLASNVVDMTVALQ